MARPYFPFEVVDDLRKLGLHAAEVVTQLGSVRVFGSADSRVHVLFLHGVGMDSTMWSPLLLQASEDGVPTEGWTFIDLPGFGESDDLQGPVTMAEVGASLIEALNQMSVASCHLVGHSMGGFLAMDVAARYPERFSSVCVVNGAYSSIVDTVNAPLRAAGRSPTTTVMYAMMVGVAQAGRAGTLALRGAAVSGALRAGLIGAAAHPIHVRTSLLTALARGSRPRSFLRAQATGIEYDYRAIWSSLQVPLLALFGRSDHLVGRRDAAILAECQPAAVIRWIDDAGHFTPVEQPGAVLRALGDWWQRAG